MSLNVESVEFKAFILFTLQEIKNSFLRPKLNATIFLRTTISDRDSMTTKKSLIEMPQAFQFSSVAADDVDVDVVTDSWHARRPPS